MQECGRFEKGEIVSSCVLCMASGFRVNMGKSECKVFGVRSYMGSCGWKDCVGGLRVLGVKFDCDLYGRESWEDVRGKLEKKKNFRL